MDTPTALIRQLAAVIPLLLLLLGPLSVAGWLLLRQQRRARLERLSPLVRDLMRFPGQTLRDQIEQGRYDLAWEASMLVSLPSIVTAVLITTFQFTGRPVPLTVMAFALAGVVGYSMLQTRKILALSRQLDQWRLGFDAEAAAGQDLDALMRQGAYLFHDVPGEKFNVDHVVVSPQGVFAVETKGYRKPNNLDGGTARATVVFDGQRLQFPDWSSDKPLSQAERQARWLSQWLSTATGDVVRATPVLALPGWFIELKGRGPVRVFNNTQLKSLLQSRDTQRLESDQIQRILHQLEQRCRNVKPTYGSLDEGQR